MSQAMQALCYLSVTVGQCVWLKAEQSGSVEQLPSRGPSWEWHTQNRRESPQTWAGEQTKVQGH